MSIQKSMRQMSTRVERREGQYGEARRESSRNEAQCPRYTSGGTGLMLLEAALTKENLKHAFRRVRANKGSAGVDGLDVDQTALHLVTV
jgi:RNA-directed DNA polymerase